jgi:hypothetical protein
MPGRVASERTEVQQLIQQTGVECGPHIRRQEMNRSAIPSYQLFHYSLMIIPLM